MRILTIDDELGWLQHLEIILRSMGHTVRGLRGSANVVSTMKEFEPQGLIIDYMLNKETGTGILELLEKEFDDLPPYAIYTNYGRGTHQWSEMMKRNISEQRIVQKNDTNVDIHVLLRILRA